LSVLSKNVEICYSSCVAKNLLYRKIEISFKKTDYRYVQRSSSKSLLVRFPKIYNHRVLKNRPICRETSDACIRFLTEFQGKSLRIIVADLKAASSKGKVSHTWEIRFLFMVQIDKEL